MWHWLTQTDAGLFTRIAVGVAILLALLIFDLRRRGRESARGREYLFLLVAVAAAMAYGAANDLITVTISPEYFIFGKGLDAAPGSAGLRVQAVLVGLKATWTAGLLIGVALLVANNPMKSRLQLPYLSIYALLPAIVLAAACCGAALGVAGYRGWLTPLYPGLREIAAEEIFRPSRFMCVWGIHLGGYAGGFAATVVSAVWMLRRRLRLASPQVPG